MIPLSVQGIFNFIERSPEREFVLRVSYLEIYNEIINDLLDPRNTNLRVREDKSRGVFVENLKEDVVMSPEQVCISCSISSLCLSHWLIGLCISV
jgi:centromeric protein E